MDEIVNIKKQRGRPAGCRLSELTKDKIRQKRLGTSHSLDTKNKISKSLTAFFKARESLTDSISEEYINFSDEVSEWFIDNKEELDESDLIMTEKRLSCMRTLEICIGHEIEQLFGHNANPEFFLLLKEEIKKFGNVEDITELNSLI